MNNKTLIFRIFISLFTLSFLYSCAVNPVTGKKQLMFMSEEQEIAMGVNAHPQILAQMGEYKDDKLQKFITEKGNDMARISHRPHLNYKFTIVDDPVVNAFAVPGGNVYFTRGIMAHFNSEAEFMGVLGHEIGHITARHSASQQAKQTLWQVGLMGGMIFVPELQQFGNELTQGMQLLFLHYSRENETQSDELGVDYSTKVGYDAHQMGNFFQVLHKQQLKQYPNGIPVYTSTHPNPGDRYHKVHSLAKQKQIELGNPSLKVGRNSYLRMIDGIVFGEDPRQGYIEKGIFYHPQLKFQYPVPSGWQFQNSPSQVRMGSKSGKAMIIFTFAGKDNLRQSAEVTLKQLGLQVTENKETNINGMPALLTISTQIKQNQQGQSVETLRIVSAFIKKGDTVYVFHGLATPNDFGNYFNTFKDVYSHFRQITDTSKLNRKPDRIRIKTVNRRVTLERALRSIGIPENELEKTALLNNMELSTVLEPGTLVKTVGK